MAVFQPGRLVASTAGRDRGSVFVVLRVDSDGFVWVVDGEKRTLEHPKKKNRKHLKPFLDEETELMEKWSRGEPVDNSEIREVLQRLRERVGEAV